MSTGREKDTPIPQEGNGESESAAESAAGSAAGSAVESAAGSAAGLAFVLQELSDLVRMVQDAESKELISSASFVEVHKKLLEIRKQINLFREEYKKDLTEVGLTPEDVVPTPEAIEKLNPKEKKLLQQLNSLQSVCEENRERLYQSMRENQEVVKDVQKELKGKGKGPRKSKFKSVGGKDGWMPT